MKLLTKEIQKALPPLYSQEKAKDPTVVVKFFTPDSSWTWLAYEGQQTEDGDWEFFGLVSGLEVELGYWRLSELESARGPFGLKVERDLYFTPCPLSEAKVREHIQ